MIKDVIIKQLNKFEDARGWLAEIYRSDEVGFNPAMGYISITKPGVARGPHEHRKQADFFIFPGPGNFMLYLWDNRNNSIYGNVDSKGGRNAKFCVSTAPVIIEVGEKNPVSVVVPPGVVHGYKCVSETSAMSINLPDRLYRGKGKKEEIDEIRWENDETSPFKIL